MNRWPSSHHYRGPLQAVMCFAGGILQDWGRRIYAFPYPSEHLLSLAFPREIWLKWGQIGEEEVDTYKRPRINLRCVSLKKSCNFLISAASMGIYCQGYRCNLPLVCLARDVWIAPTYLSISRIIFAAPPLPVSCECLFDGEKSRASEWVRANNWKVRKCRLTTPKAAPADRTPCHADACMPLSV